MPPRWPFADPRNRRRPREGLLEYFMHKVRDPRPSTSRMSKGLSSPRRCSFCQKVMFFKTYRCKHCRYRCHKKCAGHSRHHKASHQGHKSSLSGEDHWTKVLQANEVNSNVVVLPCQNKRTHHLQCKKSKHRQRAAVESTSSAPTETKEKDNNIFSNLYARFCQWVSSSKKDDAEEEVEPIEIKPQSAGRRSPCDGRSRSNSIQSTQELLHYQMSLAAQTPEHLHKCYHTSVSSDDSDIPYNYASFSSTCSSLTITSTSTATSDCQSPFSASEGSFTGGGQQGYYKEQDQSGHQEGCPLFARVTKHICNSPRILRTPPPPPHIVRSTTGCSINTEKQQKHSNLTCTISCPTRTEENELTLISQEENEKTTLCATWPPVGRKFQGYEPDLPEEPELEAEIAELESKLSETGSTKTASRSPSGSSVSTAVDRDETPKITEQDIRDSLGECSIPYADLQFSKCIRVGRNSKIHRGRWHGEVMIHELTEDMDVTSFWQEVSTLSMIRHENVALFMGACIEPPHLAIVTSVRRGASLFDQIHILRDRMSLSTRIHIARHISQGMGYLHAKGIVMKKLNSKNIYLESKVKLCLMDYGTAEKKYDRPNYGCLPRGHLTYVAPEIMCKLRVEPPRLVCRQPYTLESDVFAFGTVLYELMSGRFPFLGMVTDAVIWQMTSGKRQPLNHLRCNTNLKKLIMECWLHDPMSRPQFTDINKELQQNPGLHKRHSSSEPEKLNRSGLPRPGRHLYP